MTFPAADTDAAFAAIRRDEVLLRPGVDALCRDLGAEGEVVRFADGSLPVYAVGADLVLKLYPPVCREERDREALVLELLADRLPIPTPRLRGRGERDGWGFVWMERLRGESLATRWPALPDPLRVARALGEALAVLHGVRDPRLATLSDEPGAYLARQRQTAVERQRARGLEGAWLDQVPAFLEGLDLDGPPVLLHTEVMREHLLVDGDHLSGLFDFEPARLGPAEYELASVGLFVTAGDRAAFRALLEGYGRDPDEPGLPQRVLGHALLHQYSNFPWYLRRVPPAPEVRTLDDLANTWFGTR